MRIKEVFLKKVSKKRDKMRIKYANKNVNKMNKKQRSWSKFGYDNGHEVVSCSICIYCNQ